MRKEVVWAIIAGVILGLVVAFGVYRINSSVTKNKKVTTVEQTPEPSPQTPQEFKVIIDKPVANDVVIENTVSVSGLTKSLSWVTFSGEDDDYTIQADTSGSFTQDVSLTPGINHIKVTAFDSNGNQSSASILVVYSSSFQIRTLPSGSPSVNASDSSDIRQKVAQGLANTLSRPKAYIGTVTDITDSTIEIKTKESDIQQISINASNTNVVNSVGTTTKQVKTSDIAIGDFIIAMGYIETSSVLGAQRILISDPTTEPKITVKLGNLTDIDKKITLTKTAKTKLAKIKDEDKIIFVTTSDNKGVSTIRSIFVI